MSEEIPHPEFSGFGMTVQVSMTQREESSFKVRITDLLITPCGKINLYIISNQPPELISEG
jgi:hypothetical protein